MSRRYDWSRFRRYLEPSRPFLDEDEEPTARIPRETMERVLERPQREPAELAAELLQHAEAGQ